jgi:hypothetical protein
MGEVPSYNNQILIIAGIIAAVVFILVYLYRKYKLQLLESTQNGLNKGVEAFHSFGRVRFLVVIMLGVFLSLFALMIGLIQDFLSNEFAEFNTVTSFVIHAIFDENWSMWMNRFAFLASFQVFVPLIAFTLIWVLIRGKDRILEAGFLLFVIIGGEVWDEGL